jgi:hypothetical protein
MALEITRKDAQEPTELVDRRAWLGGLLRLGGGVGALALVSATGGCEGSEEASPAPAPAERRMSAPEAMVLLHPLQQGDFIEKPWRIEGFERSPEGSLLLYVRDVVHGGRAEIVFLRHEGEARPVANTKYWDLHLWNGGQGTKETPQHLIDLLGLVGMTVIDNEDSPAAKALLATARRTTAEPAPAR